MSGDVAELDRQMDFAPAEWRQVTLGKVVRIVTDGISAADLAALPRVHHYSLPAFDEGAGPEVGPGDTIKSNKTVVPDDCVLFSKLNPRIPRIWRVRGDAPPRSYCSTEFWPLVAQGSGVDLDYLTQYLSSAAFLGHPDITPSSSTNSHQRVDRNAFERFEFVLPPLDEQRRIAEVLRSVDEAIAATQAVYDGILAAQAAAFETFLHSGNLMSDGQPITGWTTGKIDGVHQLPVGWRIVKLVEVARLESGHTPDRKKPEYWEGGDVEWISLHDTQNLERCEISQTEMRITQAGLANSSARLLPAGTVCFSRTATVGKCVIMAKSMATSQDFANFICSPDLNDRYLLHLMRWMQPVWKALASGSTHKTIYMPTFKALQIILPTQREQEEIAATMDSFVNMAEGHAASLAHLRSVKANLMSDLLSGRVRVPA